jgi:DegV family protein with EDD domain
VLTQQKVAIVVDSSSCLTTDIVEDLNISVVPHQLISQNKTYRDGIDINPSEFYDIQKYNHVTFTTSGPTPTDFFEKFQLATQRYQNIVCITVGSQFSNATLNAAKLAAQLTHDRYPRTRIEVIDSNAAAGAEGLIALQAARLAKSGQSIEQVITGIKNLIPRVRLLAVLDTLYYLEKSGRVPKMKAWAASLLGIKPLCDLTGGNPRLLAKPRGKQRAIALLFQTAFKHLGNSPVHLNIMHANAPDTAKTMHIKAKAIFNCEEVLVSEFTPVMGAHTGPGLLGLAFHTKTMA